MPSEIQRAHRTEYSERIKGVASNYHFEVRFDMTRGHLGISQFDPRANGSTERILLSPEQVRELLAFIEKTRS